MIPRHPLVLAPVHKILTDGVLLMLTAKRKRCYHRVMSGLERGGQLRFLTLTSSDEATQDIQKSWRALYMRMKRRNLIQGYIKVPELTKKGRLHLHVLFRGEYVAQALISKWWSDIHHSQVVDIRYVQLYRGKKAVASYMAKYMSKETAGRYGWSWGWVWRGFCRHWLLWKRYWRRTFERDGQTTFRHCIIGWQWWLHDLIEIDVEAMEEFAHPSYVIKYKEVLSHA